MENQYGELNITFDRVDVPKQPTKAADNTLALGMDYLSDFVSSLNSQPGGLEPILQKLSAIGQDAKKQKNDILEQTANGLAQVFREYASGRIGRTKQKETAQSLNDKQKLLKEITDKRQAQQLEAFKETGNLELFQRKFFEKVLTQSEQEMAYTGAILKIMEQLMDTAPLASLVKSIADNPEQMDAQYKKLLELFSV